MVPFEQLDESLMKYAVLLCGLAVNISASVQHVDCQWSAHCGAVCYCHCRLVCCTTEISVAFRDNRQTSQQTNISLFIIISSNPFMLQSFIGLTN
jgi:hypothetical protein